ncbi:MAG: succinylglutamate desuccinylase/aspartoacylase family protein [Anaerolineales bacterium]|nr:succinylglutamate desuccinylase/aspartoacylase family protein [Anaerolineales bacterium]
MPISLTIGTAQAQPGTLQYGRWEALKHPTGHDEFLPVIIAQGQQDGPCIWLTAGIHGNEHSGPLVLYELLTPDLVAELSGTIVAIPALSPAGLRTESRAPYHAPSDPNRMWPDGKPEKTPDLEKKQPSSLEQAYARLFDEILQTADYLIDFHNTWPHSMPFAFQDRVLYRPGEDEAINRLEAETLAARLDEMLHAFGHTIIREFPASKYIDADLHRSTSGAALLLGRIPAFTVELGTGIMPDLAMIKAAAAGTRNVLRWAAMLPGEPEPIAGIPVYNPGFPVRRSLAIRAEQAGVSFPCVKSGDPVKAGDLLAELRDIWGRPLPDGQIRAPGDGLVLSPAYGIFFYPGQTLIHLGVRDEEALVGLYPEDYFTA